MFDLFARCAVGVAGLLCAAIAVLAVVCRIRVALRARRTIGFLHPHCAAGGGGERVLWVGIAALRARNRDVRLVVYTGDRDVDAAAMRARARHRFGVDVDEAVEFCYVRSRKLSEPGLYPVATLVGQSLGSMVLAAEALARDPPDLLVDTTGFAFAFPVAKALVGCGTAAYVHYPTISSDMVRALGETAFNNRRLWTRLRAVKALYYRLFALAYRWCGRRCDAVLANSTWTMGHVRELWDRDDVRLAFPPCDTSALREVAAARRPAAAAAPVVVVSIAQFRPEKNHALQLEAWALLPAATRASSRLVVAGAARHADDEALVASLRALAATLGIEASVDFLVSAPRADLLAVLASASVGLHTMRLEHFGIAVVEFMAAGLAPLAHASGGPLLDIVGDGRDRGLVATDAADYAAKLQDLLSHPRKRGAMARAAQAFVEDRFSDAAFSTAFAATILGALP